MVCNVTVVGYMFRIVIVVHEKKILVTDQLNEQVLVL